MFTRRLLIAGLAATTLGGRPLRAAAPARSRAAGGRRAAATPAGPPVNPADTPIGAVDTQAKWAIVVDYNSGATILEKNADARMAPSSMTKLMTAYVVFGMLKAGHLELSQSLPVSEKAWRMGGSKMFVPYPGSVTVEDLIRGMITQSGNDACIVLAEGTAGSEEEFVVQMSQKAKALGLANSNFANSTGWPSPDLYMSCRDIASLAQHLISDFPEYYHFFSEKSFKYNNIDQPNRNPLVEKGLADGLKTGHTEDGGFGECASALRGARRVILVLNGMTSMHQRAEESARLMEWAFNSFEDVTLFSANDAVDRVPVWLGEQRTVPLVGGKDLQVTMPRQWKNKAQIAVQYDAPVRAPVRRGTVLGKLVVSGQGVPQLDVPLLAGADVGKLGLPGRAIAVLAHYVTGG